MWDSEVPVHSPSTLGQALHLLANGGTDMRPLAGGTDAMVKLKEGHWRPKAWVNLSLLHGELAYIRAAAGTVHIGGLTTFTAMLTAPVLRDTSPLLVKAARTVGGPAIRNVGTLGGNVGTASPAGDSLPALYALDAVVHLTSLRGERAVPIGAFITGPGRTTREPDELITAISFPAQAPTERCTFEKLGLRAAHAITVVSVALRLTPAFEGTGIQSVQVALGAVGPTILRVPEAEAALAGAEPIDAAKVLRAAQAAQNTARPIADVRGSLEYRRTMAGNLLVRGLVRLLGPAVMPGASAS